MKEGEGRDSDVSRRGTIRAPESETVPLHTHMTEGLAGRTSKTKAVDSDASQALKKWVGKESMAWLILLKGCRLSLYLGKDSGRLLCKCRGSESLGSVEGIR